jgi:hypothetical protein
VTHENDGPSFRAVFQGPAAVHIYGRNIVGTELPDHVNPKLLAGVVAPYKLCVRMARPIFTVRPSKDKEGTPVTIETLRLPLGLPGQPVSKILTHYCFISIEGRFKGFAFQDQGNLPDNTVKAIITS